MENQIAAGRVRRCGPSLHLAGQRTHGDVVGEQQPRNPKLLTQVGHTGRGQRYGPFGIDCRQNNVSRHHHWQVCKFAKRHEIGLEKFSKRSVDARQCIVTVPYRTAVAGRMLEDGQAARFRQASGQRSCHDSDDRSSGAEATIPEEGMGFGPGDIHAWGAIHVYPVGKNLGSDQEPAQVHRPFGLGRRATWAGKRFHLVKRRHPLAPVGRSHPLNAAALLIDQYRRIAADSLSERPCQAEKLVGRLAVSLEHDEPEGLRLGEEIRLPAAKFGPGRREDIRTLRHLLLHDRNAVCTVRQQHRAKAPGIGQINKSRCAQPVERTVT